MFLPVTLHSAYESLLISNYSKMKTKIVICVIAFACLAGSVLAQPQSSNLYWDALDRHKFGFGVRDFGFRISEAFNDIVWESDLDEQIQKGIHHVLLLGGHVNTSYYYDEALAASGKLYGEYLSHSTIGPGNPLKSPPDDAELMAYLLEAADKRGLNNVESQIFTYRNTQLITRLMLALRSEVYDLSRAELLELANSKAEILETIGQNKDEALRHLQQELRGFEKSAKLKAEQAEARLMKGIELESGVIKEGITKLRSGQGVLGVEIASLEARLIGFDRDPKLLQVHNEILLEQQKSVPSEELIQKLVVDYNERLDVLRQDAAAQEQELKQFYATKKELRQLSETVHVISRVISLEDEALGYKLNAAFQASISLADAIHTIGAHTLKAENTLLPYLTIANAALSLLDLFSNEGEASPFQGLQMQIQQLARELRATRVEMHERFDRIEQMLDRVYMVMVRRFEALDRDVAVLRSDTAFLKRSIETLQERIDADNYDREVRVLKETVALSFDRNSPTGLGTGFLIDDPEEVWKRSAAVFYKFADIRSTEAAIKGRLVNHSLAEASAVLRKGDYQMNLGAIGDYMSADAGVSHLDVPSPVVWANATDMLVALCLHERRQHMPEDYPILELLDRLEERARYLDNYSIELRKHPETFERLIDTYHRNYNAQLNSLSDRFRDRFRAYYDENEKWLLGKYQSALDAVEREALYFKTVATADNVRTNFEGGAVGISFPKRVFGDIKRTALQHAEIDSKVLKGAMEQTKEFSGKNNIKVGAILEPMTGIDKHCIVIDSVLGKAAPTQYQEGYSVPILIVESEMTREGLNVLKLAEVYGLGRIIASHKEVFVKGEKDQYLKELIVDVRYSKNEISFGGSMVQSPGEPLVVWRKSADNGFTHAKVSYESGEFDPELVPFVQVPAEWNDWRYIFRNMWHGKGHLGEISYFDQKLGKRTSSPNLNKAAPNRDQVLSSPNRTKEQFELTVAEIEKDIQKFESAYWSELSRISPHLVKEDEFDGDRELSGAAHLLRGLCYFALNTEYLGNIDFASAISALDGLPDSNETFGVRVAQDLREIPIDERRIDPVVSLKRIHNERMAELKSLLFGKGKEEGLLKKASDNPKSQTFAAIELRKKRIEAMRKVLAR